MDGKTSKAICATSCDVPDDRIRCSHFQHPLVLGFLSHEGKGRKISSAFCDLKNADFDAGKCFPGGNKCWEIEVENRAQLPAIPEDVADRFVDELKYFDLSFERAFKVRVLRLNDPRTIGSVLSPCTSPEDFAVKVAALVDIFNNFDLNSSLLELSPEVTGTIARLAEFLKKRQVLADDRPIKTLRNIISLRNSFPIHSGNTKFLAAYGELNLNYPPDDWAASWNTVIANAWHALRTLRLMLPA